MSLEALKMGDYGLFVWGSFGTALVVYLWNAWAPRARRRALVEALRDSEEGS